jgi:hypothetical protein
MARFLAVSTCALSLALWLRAPAAAYHVDASTQAVEIDSLRDFDECQKAHQKLSSEACLDALKVYAKAHPEDAFEAGRRARLHAMHWVALDFFVQAFSAKPSKKQCADEDVSAAVLSGLALPPHYPAVALAKKVVSEFCRRELESVVAAKLKGAGSAFHGNACPLVSPKLSGTECNPVAAAPEIAAKPVPPTPEEHLAAAVPRVREAPPKRNDAPQTPPVHRLDQVFPTIPEGQPINAPTNAVAELKGLDWRLLSLDPESAEVLRGTHGEELMMARTKPGAQEYVLLKFKGVRSPWNERVLVAIERSSARGKDYVIALDDREAVVMIERQRQYQAFPKGVTGGLWLNPVRPSEQTAVKLPARREIESEFATAATAGK